MKRITIVCVTVLSALHATAAIAKSITCSYPRDQELTFDAPKKLGGLPPIEFDYSSKVHALQLSRRQSAVGHHG